MPDDAVALTDVPAGPAQRPSILPMAIVVLLIPALLGSSRTIFNDGDVSWHIATGQWILDHHAIPHTDPFSFTWAGKPWVAIEWLAEVIYASAYRLAGYGGLAAVVTAALMALHAVIYSNSVRFTRPWIGVGLLVLLDLVLIPMLLARPHVLSWPILALWTWLMLRARAQDRAPPLLAALLLTLWANLHGGFVFGFAIAAAFGLEALVTSPNTSRALTQWLAFGFACVVAVFINGNGVAGVVHPFRFTQLKMLPLIDEWRPSSFAKTPFFYGVLAIALALIAWKRPRLPWVRWLMLAGLLGLALMQVRQQAVFAVVAAILLPEGFARAKAEPSVESRSQGWILVGAAAVLVGVRAIIPLEPPEDETNPWHLIAMVPPQLRSQPVFNGYSMGGPLILSGIRPYVDGRGDMYGDELVLGYVRIAHGDAYAFSDAVRRWNIRWAILPNKSQLIRVLDRSPSWRLIGRDRVGSIYVRTG